MTRRSEGLPADPFDLRAFLKSDSGGSLEVAARLILKHIPDAGLQLARLAAFDFDREVSIQASGILGYALMGDGLPEEMARRLLESAMPAVRELVATPSLPEERRFLLHSILLAGGDMPSPETLSSFQNLRGTLDRLASDAFSDVTDQPESLGGVLFTAGALGDDDDDPDEESLLVAASMASDIARTNASAGTALAAVMGAIAGEGGWVLDPVLSALDAGAASADPRAAWWLRELSALPTHPAYRARARTLYQQMTADGVEPAYTIAAEFSHGFVTHTDGSGARSLYLFFRRGDETDALTFLLRDSIGIKDCNLLPCAGADVEALVRAESQLLLAPCTLGLARELVGDALARQAPARQACPGSFLLCRPYLGPEPIGLRRREPDHSIFPTPSVAAARKLFRESHQLTASDTFGGFTFHSEAAFAFVAGLPDWEDDMADLDAHLDAFIEKVALPERALLLDRMAANIEHEVLAGHARRKIPRMAAVVWRALTEDPAAFGDVPYIRSLADQSIWMVSENLRLGFTSQEEADRAALEMDRQWFADSMDDDPWEFDDEEDDF